MERSQRFCIVGSFIPAQFMMERLAATSMERVALISPGVWVCFIPLGDGFFSCRNGALGMHIRLDMELHSQWGKGRAARFQ